MQRIIHHRWPIALLAVVVLLATACGGSGSSGASSSTTTKASSATTSTASDGLGAMDPAKGEPVKVGLIHDGKGAAADTTDEATAAKAAVDWINERKAGIGGRPIQLVVCETKSDAARAVQCANELIQQHVVAVLMPGSSFAAQAWVPLHAAHLPVMVHAASATELLSDPDSTYTIIDPISSVVDTPLGVAKKAKTKKVAIVVIDVPEAMNIYKSQGAAKFKAAGIDLKIIPIALGTPDMTPQLQSLAGDGTGEVFVVGGDSFCIAAYNGLASVGYKGKIASISQCVTDATRKAVSADLLKGIVLTAVAPMGANDPSIDIYDTVMKTYHADVRLDTVEPLAAFTLTAAFRDALEGFTGDPTPASINAAIKSMPARSLLAAAGQKFRCNGKANPDAPAVCTRGTLVTTLDATGHPGKYEVVGASPIPD